MPPVPTRRVSSIALGALALSLSLSAVRTSAAEEATALSSTGLTRPNGRQVVRLEDQWVVITPDPSGHGAWLATGTPNAPPEMRRGRGEGRGQGEGWQHVRFLSPDGDGLFRSKADRPYVVPPSLGVDFRRRVHVAWDAGDEVWYAHTLGAPSQGSGLLSERTSWAGVLGGPPSPLLADAALGDLEVTDAGEVWIAAVKHGAHGASTLCLARSSKGFQWDSGRRR